MSESTKQHAIRIIFHVDVNSAFLSWSAVERLRKDPDALDLRTVPSVVAGNIETRHGIVTAKSIPAKKYGIETAETVASALRKYPNLILVKADFKTYRKYSREFLSILREYSDCVEQASIDEAYVDMTEPVLELMDAETRKQSAAGSSVSGRETAYSLAKKMKDEIRRSLGFTVNIGISTNKLLAKTASDFRKPDRIHTLWPEEVPEKLWPLPIRSLFGCGAATAKKLSSIGIVTVGDAAHTEEDILKSLLGEKGGEFIFCAANGIGSDLVRSESEEAKGYSNELTTAEDIGSGNYRALGVPMVQELAEKVAARLQRDDVYAKTIGVMVKTDTFRRRSRQTTLEESTNSTQRIRAVAQELMLELLEGPDGLFVQGRKIRLIGVSATKIDHGEFRQMNLFEYANTLADQSRQEEENQKKREAWERKTSERRRKQEELDAMMEKVRKRYGEGAISKGMEESNT